MGKKKRRPHKKPRSQAKKKQRRSAFDLPPPAVIQGMMEQLMGGLIGDPEADETPLGKAQQLVYDAYDTDDPEERVALAREALELSRDCADAYLILAEHAPTRQEALRLVREAVAAGERAIGPEMFRDRAGEFWLILETRPHMRARLTLAEYLWDLGERDEAISHLRELLRLNPNDNQGVRYILLRNLYELDRFDEVAAVLETYKDDWSAAWAYTRALLAFRRAGDTPASRKLLQAARKVNKYVPAYLLGDKPLPRHGPDYISPGDASEAAEYALAWLGGWKAASGSLDWLRAVLKKGKAASAEPARTAPAQGPLPLVKARLKKLPQDPGEVWQADVLRLPVWVGPTADERRRPWLTLALSATHDLVLAHEITEEPPDANHLWDTLARAMQQPAAGDPRRPGTLHLRGHAFHDALAPPLGEVGVACKLVEELGPLDAAVASLVRFLNEDHTEEGLLSAPGVTPEQVGRFFEAAAEFYRFAPWRKVGEEMVIRVASTKHAGGPWYAVIIGRMGMTAGLVLYDDFKVLRQMWAEELPDEENAARTVALSLTYGSEGNLAAADVEAAERYGWPVAGPEAYPLLFRKEAGMAMRAPHAWELELMEGCLRAIPEFMGRHKPSSTAAEPLRVPVAAGELELILSWASEE